MQQSRWRVVTDGGSKTVEFATEFDLHAWLLQKIKSQELIIGKFTVHKETKMNEEKSSAEMGRETAHNMESMDVDIIEFYPNSNIKTKLIGWVHVYFPAFDLDVRGVMVILSKKGQLSSVFAKFPFGRGTHHLSGDQCKFHIVGFANQQRNKAVLAGIKDKLPEFVGQWIKEHQECEQLQELIK